MSNPLKAIGKVFKSIVKVVKNFAPIILASAAIYFGAGIVSGALPNLTGGLGGAFAGTAPPVSSGVGSLAAAQSAGSNLAFANAAAAKGVGGLTAAQVAGQNLSLAAVAPSASQVAGSAAGNVIGQAPSILSPFAEAAKTGIDLAKKGGGKLFEFGKDVVNYAGENPVLAAGAIQGIGAAAGGYYEAQAREDELDFEKNRYENGYDGVSVDPSYPTRTTQNQGIIARPGRTPQRQDDERGVVRGRA